MLLNLAFIAERHMMPSLMNISRKYGISKDLTGIIVAVGGLVPELTTTVLSFMRHGVKMTEFGIASNVGSAFFSITVVPAIAILSVSAAKESN
jgi:Ca2+/Na+ antiporter